MNLYDQYYLDENYFGKPYRGLMDFFETAARGSLVDLGAGQGRDSIPLAGMGYDVTAVDVSSVGLAQINAANPHIQTVIGDLYTFDVSAYDYVLMNSIVHFYKNDLEKETTLIQRLLKQMKPGAIFVNCLLKNKRAERILKSIVGGFTVSTIHEEYTAYPEFDATYHMLVLQKPNDEGATA